MDLDNGPAAALKMVMAVDPTYSISTHYNLIAACMVTMPAIMALLVKKGGSELLDAVNNGVSGFAGNIGNTIGRYMTSTKVQEGKLKHDQRVINSANRQFFNAMMQPDMLNLLGGQKLVEAGAKYTEALKDPAKKAMQNQIAGEFTEKLTSAFSSLTKADAAKLKKEFDAQYAKNIHIATINETLKPENLQLAQDMVFLGLNSHDFAQYPSAGKWIDVLAARTNFNYAAAIQGNPLMTIPAMISQVAAPDEPITPDSQQGVKTEAVIQGSGSAPNYKSGVR